MKFFNKLKGFTLAEILITLGIIGIISALTIPSIVTKYQKRQTVVKLKKTYSMLNEVINRAKIDHGDPINWDWPMLLTYLSGGSDFSNKYFVKYLNIKNDYSKENGGRGKGFPDNYLLDNTKLYMFYPYELSDGTLLSIGSGMWSSNEEPTVVFTFDINGDKKPNVLGKDIFKTIYFQKKGFYYSNYYQKVKYTHFSRSTVINLCKTNVYSTYCFDIIKDNNWKFPDDYPW